MTVGLRVGNIMDEIGSADYLHSFFSTISANLEPGWGLRFPVMMTVLYAGSLPHQQAAAALAELALIRSELAELPAENVVWEH